MNYFYCLLGFFFIATSAGAQTMEIPTRPGVVQKLLVSNTPGAKASLILFPGGHGGLQLYANGSMKWGDNNFLVRTRQNFVDQGFNVIILDAPSDRQSPPFLQGFRQRPEHVADIKAVIAWVRETSKLPVWLVGTSRGTQSVAYIATELTGPEGPDGIVLTASILADDKSRSVLAMPLGKIHIPALIVHHEQDGCEHCPFALAPQVMDGLRNAPRKELLAVTGGSSSGDACKPAAYHGFNGIEQDVVQKIGAWLVNK
ncbi:alpha/beta hydrolase [Azonexus sp.]|uniref:alpha/beta hydrolase n=1 Tax=Azonexus sp. TaxID=1872668 RepID=UPI0039E3678C